MDKRSYILRHLYGEAEDPAELGSLLEEDEALRLEYQALSEVKFHLDQRPRQRPDACTIEAIMAAAAQPARAPARTDRPARLSPAMRRVRAAGMVSAALAVLVAVGVVLWPHMESSEMEESLTLLSEPASVAQESEYRREIGTVQPSAPEVEAAAAPSFADTRAPQAVDAVPNEAGSSDELAVPGTEALIVSGSDLAVAAAGEEALSAALDWDQAEDVRRLHRHVELLEVRSTNWSWADAALTPAVDLQDESRFRTLDQRY